MVYKTSNYENSAVVFFFLLSFYFFMYWVNNLFDIEFDIIVSEQCVGLLYGKDKSDTTVTRDDVYMYANPVIH